MIDDIRSPRDQNKNFEPKPKGSDVVAMPPDVAKRQAELLSKQNEHSVIGKSVSTLVAPPKKGIKHRFTELGLKLWPSTKKQKIIGSVVLIILLVGGFFGVRALTNNKLDVSNSQTKLAKSTTEPSRLTGVPIKSELNKRPVTSVQIENSIDARPQSGLLEAGIVFEAVAEGGITRFNAMFLEGQPSRIGPVRSIRPYYIDFFLPFDASLVHAGGSAQGLELVRAYHVKDIDHGANAEAFQRVASRIAPHNLYTSMAQLDKVSKSRGYLKSTFTSLSRTKRERPATKPTARKIDFFMSGPLYNVHYDYNTKRNSYLRSEGGAPHLDEPTKKQLAPKVVVALMMRYSQNGIYSVYQTTGTGKMIVFQNGTATAGTWRKANIRSQFVFTDQSGQPLLLNPGQTWFTIVTGRDAIRFTP